MKILKDKLKIETFRNDEWFNKNIWDDDLDKNEIVELVLNEISKDIKEFLADEIDELGTMLNQIKIINGAIGEVKEKEKIELCKDLQKDIECNIRELKAGEEK